MYHLKNKQLRNLNIKKALIAQVNISHKIMVQEVYHHLKILTATVNHGQCMVLIIITKTEM